MSTDASPPSEEGHILVVEDDPAVAASLVRGLRRAGFSVELAVNGQEGLRRGKDPRVRLIVLDLLLPERHGCDVLAGLRGSTSAPVVVLSACSDLPDRLRCFSLGAVDYVCKPFFLEELLARVRARLGLSAPRPRRVLPLGALHLDLDARRVRAGEAALELTRHEFDVLAYLAERPGRALSRHQIAEAVLDGAEDVDPRTVDSHVARLRRKLGAAGAAIVTVWGIGYRLDLPEAPR